MLAVAVAVVAVAVAGPVYARAADESILADGLRAAPPSVSGLEAQLTAAAAPDPLATLQAAASGATRAAGMDVYERPVSALELDLRLPAAGGLTRLAFRTGSCPHLLVTSGRCPTAANEIVVSERVSRPIGWRIGDSVSLAGIPAQTIVGIYIPRDAADGFWFGRSYFPAAAGDDGSDSGAPTVDALFTDRATFSKLPVTAQIRAVVDLPLSRGRVRVANADRIAAGALNLPDLVTGGVPGATASTGLAVLLKDADTGRRSLAVPLVVVVVQLLALCWLVLYGVVATAVEARSAEIALAKLRGQSPASTLALGLMEPLLLVVLAVPLGLVAGLLAVRGLASLELAAGTPVRLTGSALTAALGAAAGAAVAVALAARATLTRPVSTQWRRTSCRPPARSWVVDAVVLTLCAAALGELYVSGALGGGRIDVLALMAPGLLAVAVALLGARLLPLLCSNAFGPSRRRYWLPSFLAVRQVARRSGATAVVVLLGTAFGLATFGLVARSVAQANWQARALTVTGAPTVVTVAAPAGLDLPSVVRRIDPHGRYAMAVKRLTLFQGGDAGLRELVAADSPRLARVAFWRSGFADSPLAELATRLRPAAAHPLLLRGDGVGVDLAVDFLQTVRPVTLVAELRDPAGRTIDAPLGQLRQGGRRSLRVGVDGCLPGPCRLLRLSLDRPAADYFPITVSMTVVDLSVHTPDSGWATVAAGLDRPGSWRSTNRGAYSPPDILEATPAGLRWRFVSDEITTPGLTVADSPDPLPALVTAAVAPRKGERATVTGLDGQPLQVAAVTVASTLPAAAANGVLVDYTYADRLSSGDSYGVTEQVWLTADAPPALTSRLTAAGVRVVRVQRAADLAASYGREGPALALLLFLAGAGAAAVLAAAGTVLTLTLQARRRSYELAALAALGVRRRTLLGGIVAEHGLLLCFGGLTGVAAGIVGAALAMPSIPQFTSPPLVPPLVFQPDVALLAGCIGAAMLGLLAAVTLTGRALVATAAPSRLREVQQ
jgi:putative ABC transport system permease protein